MFEFPARARGARPPSHLDLCLLRDAAAVSARRRAVNARRAGSGFLRAVTGVMVVPGGRRGGAVGRPMGRLLMARFNEHGVRTGVRRERG